MACKKTGPPRENKMGDGVLYTEDHAISACDVLMQRRLIDAELNGASLEYTVGGTEYRQKLRPLNQGGYNMVYSVERSDGPLVVRVSTPLEDEQKGETAHRIRGYKKEIDFMRRMGDLGIGPRVYAELRLGNTGIGVVTEKLEFSLFDAESCPFLARRAFVEADAEAALVDLYGRSSRIFTCIDTKSENVLFNAGARSAWGKITAAPRIAMIDMDAKFCKERGPLPPTTKTTTIADIAIRLRALRGASGGDTESEDPESDDYLDATCMSLLIHCVFSMSGNEAGTGANGFPYARVAVCLYNNWDAVWNLLIRSSRGGDSDSDKDSPDEFYAADMVAAYYHPAPPDEPNFLLEGDKGGIKAALARAVRSPMTRLMLATHGLDVDERMQLVDMRRVGGDMYERLATLPVSNVDRAEFERDMMIALESGRLELFVGECESKITRSPWFVCVHSWRSKTTPRCKHGAQKWSGAGGAMTPMRVQYSDAAYPEHREALSGGPVVLKKLVGECNPSETARFVCHLLRSQTHTDTSAAYASALRVLDEGWTGMTLVSMHRNKSMINGLIGIGIPIVDAANLAATIGSFIKRKSYIRKLAPCLHT
jgi:hypothetical protein